MRPLSFKRHRFPADIILITHAGVDNAFYTQRHLISRTALRSFRSAANDAWSEAAIAA